MKRIFLFVLVLSCSIAAAQAQVPATLSYQGILTSTTGTLVADGAYSVVFSLYTASVGGTALWSETQSITIEQGIISAVLGSVSPIALPFDSPYYLGIAVNGGSELTPRMPLVTTAYSFRAKTVESVTSGSIANGIVVRSLNGLSEALTLQAGENVAISTSGSVLTIAATRDEANDGDWSTSADIVHTTASVGIGTDSPAARLHVVDGGILATGEIGSVPVTTAGVRMMWIPSKKAFRAGEVTGDHWTTDSIGSYSAACGYDTKAIGNFSFAAGWRSRATGTGAFVGAGYQNTAVGGYSFVGGGWDNSVLGNTSFIGGGQDNVGSGHHAFIGSGEYNLVSGNHAGIVAGYADTVTGAYAFIGSGYGNTVSGSYSIVVGGSQNRALSSDIFLGGGYGNTASNANVVLGGGYLNTGSGFRSVLAGGSQNYVAGAYTAMVGGSENRTSSDYAFVGGGALNLASANYATVAGGRRDTASGSYAFIGAGSNNMVSSSYACIGAGLNNRVEGGAACIGAGTDNTASGYSSFIGSGYLNTVSGSYSSIGGGYQNTITGLYSSIAGGYQNSITAHYSFAAGYRDTASQNHTIALGTLAKAQHTGAIVISASNNVNSSDTVSSGNSEQFVVRADGGIFLTNRSTIATIPANVFLYADAAGGAHLTNGGVWTNASDKNLKENIRTVDGRAILHKINELPLWQWNYKTEPKEIQHIGPMAQDFYQIFALGANERSISTIDPAGVALVGIQELYRSHEQLQKENKQLRQDNHDLLQRLEALEVRVHALVSGQKR